jgi:hypothetical protein
MVRRSDAPDGLAKMADMGGQGGEANLQAS